MPVFGKREPADKRGLYERIRGPSKEEVETAVRENFGLKEGRYIETRYSDQQESIQTPCVVFLIIGKFDVGGETCDEVYKGYTITDESAIKLWTHSAVVIMPLT
ncbi:hypothetical protein FPOA_14016 [Fusarium poae]|jgi:hypothetical protein|uniref:Uncharacterized protein n=1 Tax=Fusarium poae TaxID=36050 RepID=A0A1B8A3E4_FUSPO|nr:hypothetical protein FPOA_14016 [Fusarium poae]